KDPFTGTVFVFRAKQADRLKLLYWDGTGLVMAYKRLEDHGFTVSGVPITPSRRSSKEGAGRFGSVCGHSR
ncbi:IS66 family insertion sequence element accessory protein TnpB, partial [Rhodobacteraceae bacterium CYK-10]|nr:IS66 family insertion sequence element accessory protein TnpB [Stagnihabitans tardus]